MDLVGFTCARLPEAGIRQRARDFHRLRMRSPGRGLARDNGRRATRWPRGERSGKQHDEEEIRGGQRQATGRARQATGRVQCLLAASVRKPFVADAWCGAAKNNVHFTPESGHVRCNYRCPLWAKSGHIGVGEIAKSLAGNIKTR
jgi:hypothetical protein